MNETYLTAIDTLAITPEERVFGVGSLFVGSENGVGESLRSISSVCGEASYEIAVLMILFLYIIWVGRSFNNRGKSVFRISNPFGDIKQSRSLGGTIRVGDLILDWGLAMSMVSLMTTRVVDLSQRYSEPCAEFARRIVEMGMGRWLVLVGGSFLLSVGWSIGVFRFMSSILRCDWIRDDIFLIKSRLLLIAVAWLLPAVLMSTLEMNEFFMTYVAILGSITFIGIYLFRTFSLFRTQKISILHWILYLCSVELIPITMMWVFFVRQSS